MDISLVRRHFQRSWDFSAITNYTENLFQAYYSLQQESLNSDDMLLYVTNPFKPNLEGHVIEAKAQRWIVYQVMKEVVNQQLYEFRLYPAISVLTLKVIDTAKNAIGTVSTVQTGASYALDCYVLDYSIKERSVPTPQPEESNQQTFIVAAKQLPPGAAYVLSYKDKDYKIDSLEPLFGIYKIKATRDV